MRRVAVVERGYEVVIKNGVLTIRDRELKLLAKVKLSANRLYLLNLSVVQPACLAAMEDEAWLWHARFGHLNFEALASMSREGMAQWLPRIEHVSELCDSCLAGKQKRSSFSKKAKYRAGDWLELVHSDVWAGLTGDARQEVLSLCWWTTAHITCGFACW